MKIKFERSFAGNWKAGEIVKARPLDNGEILVDDVAAVDANELFQYAIVLPESEEANEK